jgi:hypothetical protein
LLFNSAKPQWRSDSLRLSPAPRTCEAYRHNLRLVVSRRRHRPLDSCRLWPAPPAGREPASAIFTILARSSDLTAKLGTMVVDPFVDNATVGLSPSLSRLAAGFIGVICRQFQSDRVGAWTFAVMPVLAILSVRTGYAAESFSVIRKQGIGNGFRKLC